MAVGKVFQENVLAFVIAEVNCVELWKEQALLLFINIRSHSINKTWKMAGTLEFLSVLRRVGFSLSNGNFSSLNFKPLEVKCFESILKGQGVVGVLPTGFGKPMLFHLLPQFIPVKKTKNIVIMAYPLDSIIEDQLKVLKIQGITADVLQLVVNKDETAENLLEREHEPSELVAKKSTASSRRSKCICPSRGSVK